MVGTKWIYRLAKAFYSIRNLPFSHCDLVVPLGYALLNPETLPDAAKKTLQEAIRIASVYRAPIAWASSNYLWPGSEKDESQLKILEINNSGLMALTIIGKGITNSITEAQEIHQTAIEAGIKLESKTIVVVADWPHARSARKIWRKVFPQSTIVMISVDGKWNESHPCFFQRSELKWLAINLIRHFALIVFGMKIVGTLHQPTSKKG